MRSRSVVPLAMFAYTNRLDLHTLWIFAGAPCTVKKESSGEKPLNWMDAILPNNWKFRLNTFWICQNNWNQLWATLSCYFFMVDTVADRSWLNLTDAVNQNERSAIFRNSKCPLCPSLSDSFSQQDFIWAQFPEAQTWSSFFLSELSVFVLELLSLKV